MIFSLTGVIFRLYFFRNTLKKVGRVFRNIGKYNPILFNWPYLFFFLIIPRVQTFNAISLNKSV